MSDRSKFKNSRTRLTITCNNHNKPYVFRQTIGKHIHSKHGCPLCSESKAEMKMASVLDGIGVAYEREKEFDGMTGVNGGNLRIDFYLKDFNLAIEVDGEQHFKEFRFAGKMAKPLSYTKANDERKGKFLKEKGINLIRIPFYRFDMMITNEEIKKLLAK